MLPLRWLEYNFNTENFDMVWHGFLKHSFDLQNPDKKPLIQSLNKKEGNEDGRGFPYLTQKPTTPLKYLLKWNILNNLPTTH